MRQTIVSGSMILTLVALATVPVQIHAQTTQTQYPTMAPLDQYLIADRNAEIALARSAAPPSISAGAEVMVLGRNGYEIAAPASNDFVCFVARSWDGAPDYWNPKVRGPICFNAAAAKSYLPIALLKTRLALAGKSQTEIAAAVQAAFNDNELPALEPGAMCYMMSKQGYLTDHAGHWHPHVMFYEPATMGKTWGANLDGSPVLASDDTIDHLTVFMIPVAQWSDGTADAKAGN
jgi:hypothetical protein